MKPGDNVIWTFTTSGRDSKPIKIKAVVLKVTSPRRVTIEFSYEVNGESRRRHRSVQVEKLSPAQE
jgi:hypothetical protein